MPKRSRAFFAHVEKLECRRLLTNGLSISGITQDGDFVGPNASVGPDGIADVHIQLTGLVIGNPVDSVDILGIVANDAVHQLHWRVGSNPNGVLNAELLRVHNTTSSYFPYYLDNSTNTAGLYLSPQPAGETLSSLTVTLNYDDNSTQTATDANDPEFANISPTMPASGETVPSSLLIPTPGGQAHFVEQYSTAGNAPSHAAGDAHVALDSLPAGFSFSNITAAYLSDGIAGPAGPGDALSPTRGNVTWSWMSSGGTVDNHDLQLSVQAATSPRVADITFPPTRDEMGTQMTLRLVVLDSSNIRHSYYTQFIGGTTDVNLRDVNYNHAALVVNVSPTSSDGIVTYSDPTTGATTSSALQTLLNDTSGHFDRIHLNAGTYYIDYSVAAPTATALNFPRPIQLDGDPNAILMFTADSTAPADTTKTETDYGHAIAITSSHVALSNFKVRFLHPVYFIYDLGGSPIAAFPANYPNNGTSSLVDVDLLHLDVQGPAPAAHYVISNNGPNRQLIDLVGGNLGTLGNTGRDGRFAQRLFVSSGVSGTITSNTFRGGGIGYDGGPWTITNNNYVGSVPTVARYPANYPLVSDQNQLIPSFTDTIFQSGNPHDQTITGNAASMTPMDGNSTNPLGSAYRFIIYKADSGTGYHNLLQLNTVGGGVGRRVDDETTAAGLTPTYPIASAIYHNPYNGPEMFLNETYLVNYEGRILPLSSDAHILSLPPTNTTFYRFPIVAGDIVAILTGPNAGLWRRIAQVLDSSDFLMDDPMPAGDYRVSVVRGLVDDRYDQNTVDLTNTTSVAFQIQGNQFGPKITGNTIIGDNTTVIDGNRNYNVNVAILVESGYQNGLDPAGTGYPYPFPVPDDEWTHDPLFGAVVDNNKIQGPLGGIQIDSLRGGNSAMGRTYVSVEVKNNHFFNYTTPPNNGSPATPDTSSVLTVGSSSSKPTDASPAQVIHSFSYALLDANGNVLPNADTSLGYTPAASTSTQLYSFADPDEIQASITGNWFSPSVGMTGSKNLKIISAIVNKTPIVYSMSNATTALPITSPTQGGVSFNFSFSPASATAGVIAVYTYTSYSASQGYGFQHQVNSNEDIGAVYATDETFQVDLPNGTYDVTPILGDPSGNPDMGVQVVFQGNPSDQYPAYADVVSTNGGQLAMPTYLVTVTNGSLTMRLLTNTIYVAYIHGLTIVTRTGPDAFQFGPGGTTPSSGDDLVSNYTGYTTGLSYGFTQGNKLNSRSGTPGAVTFLYATFQVDLPNGLYVVTPSLGATGASDSAAITIQGTAKGSLATSSGIASRSYVVYVANQQLSIQFVGGPDGVALEMLTIRRVTVQGDYDGDGKADLAAYGQDPTTGRYRFKILTSTTNYDSTQAVVWDNQGVGFGNISSIPVVGDYFGDAKDAYAIWSPNGSGYMILQVISSVDPSKTLSINFGLTTDVPVVADVDGDGKADFGVFGYDPNLGWRYDFLMSSKNFDVNQPLIFNNYNYGYGSSTASPVVADFEGEGHAGFGVYIPSGTGGTFTYINVTIPSGTTGAIVNPAASSSFTVTYGFSTDVPMAVDYNGDGKADLAFYGLDTRTGKYRYDVLYAFSTSSSSFAQEVYFDNAGSGYGYSATIPIMDDYLGDSTDQFAVFQPDGGSGTEDVYQDIQIGHGVVYDFATSTDLPVTGPTSLLAKKVRAR